MDDEIGKRATQPRMVRIWERLHATYHLSVRPSYDFDGDNLRVVLFWLILAFLLISAKGWLTLIPAVNDREVALSLLMFLVPLFGAGFALGQIDRRSRLFQFGSKTYKPLTPRWLNWLAEHNPIIKRRMLSFLRRADPLYRAIFWIAYGILLWGWGNVFWLFLQVFVTHDLVNAPPDWMAHDLFYVQLEVGWLLGVGEISKVLLHESGNGRSQTSSFLRLTTEAALQTVRLLKSSGATALICVGVILAGNVVIGLYADGQWFNLAGVDGVDVLLAVTYGILDGAALATVIWLWRQRARIKEKQRTSALSFGLRWLGRGWLMWPFVTWAILYGFREPAGRPLHYTVGSLYDIVGLVVVGVMIQGLLFVTHDTCGSHPQLNRLDEYEKRLAVLLLSGRSNAQIAAELGKTEKTLEADLTRLYDKTEIWGLNAGKKRTEFVEFYRRPIEAYVQREGGRGEIRLYTGCAALAIEEDRIRASRLYSDASGEMHELTVWKTGIRDILVLSDWLSKVACTNVVVKGRDDQHQRRACYLLGEPGRWVEVVNSEQAWDAAQLSRELQQGRLTGRTQKTGSASPVAVLLAARRELVRQRDRMLQCMLHEAGGDQKLLEIIRGMEYIADGDSGNESGKGKAGLQEKRNAVQTDIATSMNGRERVLQNRAKAYSAMQEWLNSGPTGAEYVVWNARMGLVRHLDKEIWEMESKIEAAMPG